MIKNIEIKNYFSPSIKNIRSWLPEDPKSVYFDLDVYIGKKNSNIDIQKYKIIVISPEVLISKIEDEKDVNFVWGRGYLIVENYSFKKVEKAIKRLIEGYSKYLDNLQDFYNALNREMWWEYKDGIIL